MSTAAQPDCMPYVHVARTLTASMWYRWRTTAQLEHHQSPVLSLCSLPCPEPPSNPLRTPCTATHPHVDALGESATSKAAVASRAGNLPDDQSPAKLLSTSRYQADASGQAAECDTATPASSPGMSPLQSDVSELPGNRATAAVLDQAGPGRCQQADTTQQADSTHQTGVSQQAHITQQADTQQHMNASRRADHTQQADSTHQTGASQQAHITQQADTTQHADAPQQADSLRPSSHVGVQVVWSGDTNGNIAAWLVPAANTHRVVDQARHDQQQQQQQQQQQRVLNLPQEQQQQVVPVWSSTRWHQSGVNSMHAAWLPSHAGERDSEMRDGEGVTCHF